MGDLLENIGSVVSILCGIGSVVSYIKARKHSKNAETIKKQIIEKYDMLFNSQLHQNIKATIRFLNNKRNVQAKEEQGNVVVKISTLLSEIRSDKIYENTEVKEATEKIEKQINSFHHFSEIVSDSIAYLSDIERFLDKKLRN